MADDRGNLALEYLRLADRLRPRWLVWENVPGVLSSNGGRDFGSFLGGLGELRYGFAYRVLDAQFFGVPQRRRRVFVIGYLGNWRRAAAVLFERESLSGNPPPRRETRERVARPIASCPPGGSGWRNDADTADNLIAHSITSRAGNASRPAGGNGNLVAPTVTGGPPFSRTGNSRVEIEALAFGGNDTRGPIDVATARLSHGGPHGHQDFESETFVVHGTQDPDIRDDQAHSLGRNGGQENAIAFSSKDHGADAGELAPTLRAGGHTTSHANAGVPPAIAFKPSHYTRGKDGAPSEIAPPLSADADKGDQDMLVFDPTQITDPDNRSNPQPGGPVHTLAKGQSPPAIAFALRGREGGAMPEVHEQASALRSASGGSSRDYVGASAVRRLTPTECERLMGAPDGFTLIPWRGGMAPDGPRYRVLGNSFVRQVIAWIGERIELVEALP